MVSHLFLFAINSFARMTSEITKAIKEIIIEIIVILNAIYSPSGICKNV